MSAIKEIYLGTKKVRPTKRTPGANTVAYYPLNSTTTVNDKSGNGYNLTGSAYSFTTLGGISCVYFAGTAGNSTIPLTNTSVPITGKRTRMCRCYANHKSSDQCVFCTGAYYGRDLLGIAIHNTDKPTLSDWYAYGADTNVTIVGGWHHLCATFDYSHSKQGKIYVDGSLAASNTFSGTYETGTALTLGSKSYSTGGSQYSEKFNGYVSEAIFENKIWTATEISDYYNNTKGNYGL